MFLCKVNAHEAQQAHERQTGEAASCDKWGRKPEKKKQKTADSFFLSEDNKAVSVI